MSSFVVNKRTGKRKYTAMRSFKLDEISGVDRPAQPHARALLIKRDEPQAPVNVVNVTERPVVKRGVLTSATDGHSHLLDDELQSGHTSWENEHSHPWVKADDGTITIGEANGHSHEAMVAKKDDAAETVSEAEVAGVPAKKEQDMSKDKAKADPKTEAAIVEKTEETKVEKAAVLYKSADGVEYTNPETAELAKRADAAEKRAAEEREARYGDQLAKRAGEELGNLAGEEATKVAALRAIDGIGDEDVRKAVLEMLAGANSKVAKALERAGVDAKTDPEDPSEKLNALARKRAAEKGELFGVAYDAVIKTDEGLELLKAHRARVS